MAQSLTRTPQMTPYREGIAATDTLPEAKQTAGVNCGGYRKLIVNVIPTGGANPTITMLVWSDKAAAFVATLPASTFAGPGADTPFSFVFDAEGRVCYPAVTTLSAGEVAMEVAGSDLDHDLG